MNEAPLKAAHVGAAEYDSVIFEAGIRALHGCDFFNVGYWHDIADKSAENIQRASRALVGLHLEQEEALGTGAPLSVLDIGCGLGATTRIFADHYGAVQVIGGNYSARQIDHARRAQPDIAFEVVDANALPFADATFDRIHAVEAAFHFEPRQTFVQEAARVLKPGGRLILTDLLYRHGIALPGCNAVRSIEDYRNRIEACGFRTLDLRDIRSDTVEPYRALLAQAGYPKMARALGHIFAYTVGVFER